MLRRHPIIELLFSGDLLQLATANDHVGVLLGLEVMNWLLQVVFLRVARCASEGHYSFLWALCHFICCILSFEKQSRLVGDVIGVCGVGESDSA